MSKKVDGFKLPGCGFVFWPVGTGDSITIAVQEDTILQVDLHHLSCSEEDDDPHTPIVDRLVELLPRVNGKPYLATFVLTHPDDDHCLGFANLVKRVKIGELWFSPRIFREYKKDLCDDAKAFREEATRRVKRTIADPTNVSSGDRVRVIGYDELLREDEYAGFPKSRLTVPGNPVTELDGVDHNARFRAFVHAPFKDDSDSERNDTSIALQVTLTEDEGAGKCLLLGDHCYPTLKRIFEYSRARDLEWNIMLAPHHCSKSAMYWCDPGETDESLRQDILDAMDKAQLDHGYIVVSSEPIPASNKPGDNPPHAKAKHRYEEIASNGLICTQEYPDQANPKPLVFAITSGELQVRALAKQVDSQRPVAAAVRAARGTDQPPRDRVGFGFRRD